MPKFSKDRVIYRIIDANINRLKEGLRVCEEVTRFILDDARLTRGFKKIRHRVDALAGSLAPAVKLIGQRDSLKDAGRAISVKEFQRRNYRDVFLANIQRAKESLRVLEEFAKLLNKKTAMELKGLRYAVYQLEKKVSSEIPSLYRRG